MTSLAQILHGAAVERSAAIVADIELGLAAGDAVDQAYWRAMAASRVDALTEVGAMYGRQPHEDEELARLKELLAAHAVQQGGGAR